MRRKSVSWLKDIVLTIVTAIASVQMIVAVAMFGQNNWDATWLPIQIGMFILGLVWDAMFVVANFPTFKRGVESKKCPGAATPVGHTKNTSSKL